MYNMFVNLSCLFNIAAKYHTGCNNWQWNNEIQNSKRSARISILKPCKDEKKLEFHLKGNHEKNHTVFVLFTNIITTCQMSI